MNSRRLTQGWCLIMLMGVLLSACDLIDPPSEPGVQATKVPYHPFVIAHVCFDTPPYYEEKYFRAAATAVADQIDQLVRPNTGGLEVFLSLINADSWHGSVLSFEVPPIPADAAEPTPLPGSASYPSPTAVQQHDDSEIAWRATVTTNHRTLDEVKQQIHHGSTDPVRHLSDPTDSRASDIWGCLDLAAAHFRGKAGRKILIIASDLINNTDKNKPQSLDLSGVTVEMVWRTCPGSAMACQESNEYWTKQLRRFGAQSVSISDTFQSPMLKLL